jgi:hypothetical protein
VLVSYYHLRHLTQVWGELLEIDVRPAAMCADDIAVAYPRLAKTIRG